IKDYLPFPKNIVYPFVQKKQYKMSVNVVETETTHIWKNMISNTSEDYQEVEINPREDVALIQYTGGTTGHPKGVMLTHFNLVANVNMVTSWMYKLDENAESVLGVLPFFHVYGMTTVMNLSIMFRSEDYQEVEINPREDVALIQYTGGTTGHPKGVMLTHFNLVANVNMVTSWMYKLDENAESVLGVLPFFHVYGMTTVMNLSIMF